MIRAAVQGELLQVRGRVLLSGGHDCLVRILTDLKGGHRDLTVPYSELARPESVDALFETVRVAIQKNGELRETGERLNEILLRVQAETYELGHFLGSGQTGFSVLGRLPDDSVGKF